MELFLFATVFVILCTQGTARPLDVNSDSGITLKLPTTIKPGYSIIMNGKLNNESDRIEVLLQSDDNDSLQIIYNYNNHTLQAIPGVVDYDTLSYHIAFKNTTYTLELTARPTLEFKKPELNVSLTVNGVEMSKPLYLAVKSFESLNSIILKEGIETIDTLAFGLIEKTEINVS